MGTSMLWILMEEWEKSSDWIVAMDMGGRFSCLTREDLGLIGEAVVREDRDEIEVVDIVEVMDGIEKVGMKSG